MKIFKIILAVLLFILSSVFLLTGIIGFFIPDFGIGVAVTFTLIGLIFLWLGILLIKSSKKKEVVSATAPTPATIPETQPAIDIEIIKQEAKEELKTEQLPVKENIENKPIENKKDKPEDIRKKTEDIIRSIADFEDCKIFHGVLFNAIAFSKSGYVLLAFDKKLKTYSISDVKSVKFNKIRDSVLNTYEYFMVFTTNDFDTPVIKIELWGYDKDDAQEQADNIIATYNALKEAAANVKISTTAINTENDEDYDELPISEDGALKLKKAKADKYTDILIHYSDASGNISARKISGVSASRKSGVKYVIAYCHIRNKVRTFRFDRIEKLFLNGAEADMYEFYEMLENGQI